MIVIVIVLVLLLAVAAAVCCCLLLLLLRPQQTSAERLSADCHSLLVVAEAVVVGSGFEEPGRQGLDRSPIKVHTSLPFLYVHIQ